MASQQNEDLKQFSLQFQTNWANVGPMWTANGLKNGPYMGLSTGSIWSHVNCPYGGIDFIGNLFPFIINVDNATLKMLKSGKINVCNVYVNRVP